MERKKRKMDVSDHERDSANKRRVKKNEKGKKKLKEAVSTSDSEGFNLRKGKKKLKEVSTSSDSNDYVLKKVKKKKKMVHNSSESEEEVSSDTGTDTGSSSEFERSSKKRTKKLRGVRAGKGRVVKYKREVEKSTYSDCEAVPQNCFGDIELVKRNTYYRSNIKTTIKELSSVPFNEMQVFEIKKTPFWMLFDAMHNSNRDKLAARCTKFEHDIRAILLRFNVKYSYFALAKKMYKVTKDDVHLILGVCGGDKMVKGSDNSKPPWIRRLFKVEIATSDENFVLYKNSVFGKLEQIIGERGDENHQDVARLTICYLLAVLLCPLRSAAIPWYVARCLERIEDAHNFDWCSYIVDTLHSQIRKSKNLKSGGCIMLLPFWLCEHTRLVLPVDQTAFPRFLRWDLSDLNDRLANFDLKKLKTKHLGRVDLKPSSGEMAILQNLRDFWDEALQRGNTSNGLSGYSTPGNSRYMPISGIGSVAVDEDEPAEGNISRNDTRNKGCLAIVTADQCKYKKGKRRVSERHCEKTPLSHGGQLFGQFPSDISGGPNFSINMTQFLSSQEEADARVQRVLDDLNATDDEGHVGEAKKLSDDIGELKSLVETTTCENKQLKSLVDEYSQKITAMTEEIISLRSENLRLVQCFGVSSELTSANICDGTEEINLIEDEACANLEKGQNLEGSKDNDFLENVEEFKEMDEGQGHGVDGSRGNASLEDVGGFEETHEGQGQGVEGSRGHDSLEDVGGLEETDEGREDLEEGGLVEVEVDICHETRQTTRDECSLVGGIPVIVGVQKNVVDESKMEVDTGLELATDELNTQFFDDPENLAKIQLIEDEVMGRLKSHGETNRETRTVDPAGEVGDIVLNDVARADGSEAAPVNLPLGENMTEAPANSEPLLDEADIEVQDGIEQSLDCNKAEEVGATSRRERGQPKSPSTIVRGVKARTLGNERKAKEFTPQPNTNELIDVDDEETDEEPNASDPPELPLESSQPAVGLLTQNVVECLKECWEDNGSRKRVWRGDWSFAEVLMSDALDIIHHKSLSTWVVDSWSEMLLKKYKEKHGLLRTKIFSAACWNLINCKTGKQGKSLKKLVDNELSDILPYSQLLFPLLSNGPSGVGKDVGNHWTLLRFDMRSCVWRFYNSNRPRNPACVDVHLERAAIIVNYVEPRIRAICSSRMPKHKLLKTEQKMPVQSGCPQQLPDSVDCGVVLCQNMEYLLAEKGLKNSTFKVKHSAEYRARMIEWFTNPIDSEI